MGGPWTARSNQSILKEINPECSLEGLMLKLKLQYFGHLMWRAHSLENTLMLGKIESRRRRGLTEDEMVGWHHWLNGHEFEQTPGDSEGQGSLEGCSPWGSQRVGHGWTTEQQQLLEEEVLKLFSPEAHIHWFSCASFFLLFPLWLPWAACGIFVPQPGIEPMYPGLEAQSLNHWTAREVPFCTSLRLQCLPPFPPSLQRTLLQGCKWLITETLASLLGSPRQSQPVTMLHFFTSNWFRTRHVTQFWPKR